VFKEILDAQVKVCSILSTVLQGCALALCPRCHVSASRNGCLCSPNQITNVCL
jgi:hypothetical protein